MANIAVLLFGSVEMRDARGRELHSLPSQRKRFGLLAYLTTAQPRGFHSRDKLMGLFWPEATRDQARHALNQALHVLRSELGEEAIRNRGDSDVAIDEAAISCDVVEFEQAVEDGEYEKALELYRGDLMEGLFVREAPEFERWLEDERTRLREKAAGAAWALAHEHVRADRLVDAERTAQRALLLVPTDEDEVRRFIQALVDAGDRAAAVRFYEKFAQRLRSEYDIEPDPLTVAVSRAAAHRHQTAVRLAGAPTAEQVLATDRNVTARPKRRARIIAAVGGLAIVTAIVVGVSARKPSSHPTHERTAIAVLPFQNLTADESRAYFASGLHDELLTQLFKLQALKVAGRTSVLGYAGTAKPITEIADELGVGSIVEASVQVEGNRLRVNVRLIDAATNQQLWADRYDRAVDDVFATQSEIAECIVTAVGATLTDAEAGAIAAPPTNNAEAYLLYLQGEQYRLRPGYLRSNLEIAQQLYERAVELDPEFALAYASVSLVHGWMHWLGYDPYPSRLESQRAAAETAVRLAPELPQVRYAMGMVHYRGERDYAKALEELTLAAEGLPGSAELWTSVGYAHRRLGHWDQALAAYERAALLDPRDPSVREDLGGSTMRFLHRYEDAIAAIDRALELAPDVASAQLNRATIYLCWRGELDSLRDLVERGPESFGTGNSRYLWRVRLALYERRPDVMLALLGAPALTTFEGQEVYEPALLYAGWAHQLQGDSAAAQAGFRDALAQLDSVLAELPDDWRVHASRGIALAGLGRQSEARDEAAWLRASPAYVSVYDRGNLAEARARIFAQAGLVEEALAEIEPLLAGPSWTSVHTLRLDPRYDPIRNDPRFQALLDKYGN